MGAASVTTEDMTLARYAWVSCDNGSLESELLLKTRVTECFF